MIYIVILMSFQIFSSINYGFKNKTCGVHRNWGGGGAYKSQISKYLLVSVWILLVH